MSRNAAQPGVAADELLAVARTSQLNASIVRRRRFSFWASPCVARNITKEARRCLLSALEIDPKYKEAQKELSDIEYVLEQHRRA